jgi:uncharacterized membrane protein
MVSDMKKTIILLLSILFSLQATADCRPQIEQDLSRRIVQDGKIVKLGKIATGTAFVTVGAFWGTMGVIMLGPLWAGAVVGATFGAGAALPIGASFVIVHKVKKEQIKNIGRTLSIISEGEELNLLHERLRLIFPELTREVLLTEINELNSSQAICNGSVARFERNLSSARRLIARPKDIERYLKAKFEEMNWSTSDAVPSNLM